jgi:hypothetical protein
MQETRKICGGVGISGRFLVSCFPAFLIFSWAALASQSGAIGNDAGAENLEDLRAA